jgi:hypothetical protein
MLSRNFVDAHLLLYINLPKVNHTVELIHITVRIAVVLQYLMPSHHFVNAFILFHSIMSPDDHVEVSRNFAHACTLFYNII